MWHSKKFIVIAVLTAVVLVGGIGGVVLAQTQTGDDNIGTPQSTLLDKIISIYQEKTGVALDQQALKDSFTQAQSEMRDEALNNRLQKLVDNGTINQEQADQYKAWLQAKPDTSAYSQQLNDWMQSRPGVPPDLEQWQDARPNMPGFGFPFGGRGGFHGMGGPRFFGGTCAPEVK